MIRLKISVAAILVTLVLASAGLAQEDSKHAVSIQGTGSFTNDTTGNGITQRTTNSGGLLASYRYQINSLLSADGSYGYNRNTFKNSTSLRTSNVQSNVHQVTGALVLNSPRKFSVFNPFALAGAGVLNFDPTGNPGGVVVGATGQNKGTFLYGAGTDINFSERFGFRLEYRGLVYDRPDFGLSPLNSGRTTHTAQPSAGFVIRL